MNVLDAPEGGALALSHLDNSKPVRNAILVAGQPSAQTLRTDFAALAGDHEKSIKKSAVHAILVLRGFKKAELLRNLWRPWRDR